MGKCKHKIAQLDRNKKYKLDYNKFLILLSHWITLTLQVQVMTISKMIPLLTPIQQIQKITAKGMK